MSPASEKLLFKLLQFKLNEYKKTFGVSKAQTYSNLSIVSTKNLHFSVMSNLVKAIQNALDLAPLIFKISFLKVFLVLAFVGSQIEKLLKKIKFEVRKLANLLKFKPKKYKSKFTVKTTYQNRFVYNMDGKISCIIHKRIS